MNELLVFLRYHIGEFSRKTFRNHIDRIRYHKYHGEKNISIISQNCIGGVMCHDLGLRFNSPTINLYMEAEDYIRFLENLDYYLDIDANELEFLDEKVDYPVGILRDIKIYFVHYSKEKDIIEKWNKRRKRINKKSLCVIMTDRDGCTPEIIDRFLHLPYRKIFFSHKKETNKDIIYMPCFKKQLQVGSLTDFCSVLGKRYYNKYFDYVKWLANMH